MYKKTPFINSQNLERELSLLIQKELENVLKSMQNKNNLKSEKKESASIKVSGEARYNLIKKRPNLSCRELGEVWREIPKSSPMYETVKKHYLQIKSKEYIQKYEDIKGKAELSSEELQIILRYVSPKAKSYIEIQQHYHALISKETYEQEMEILLTEKNKRGKRKAFMKKCGTILGYIKIRHFSFKRSIFRSSQKSISLPS